MAGHAQLNFVMTECSKTQIGLTGLIYEAIKEILLMLQVCIAEDPEIQYLLYGAPFCSETSLTFCNDLFNLRLGSV